MDKEHIYRVAFNEPPIKDDDRTDFFYTSMSAIYDEFTPEQIGCKVSRLWNIGVTKGATYNGAKCRISKESLKRKSRNPLNKPDNNDILAGQ